MSKNCINLDFDGTVVTHAFPEIGKDMGAQFVLRELVNNDVGLILFTMRCDHDFVPNSLDPNIENIPGLHLTAAVKWFEQNNIPLYGIQTNPTQHSWTSSPKSYAPYMIDDSAIGCPLLLIPELSLRPFVDWCEVAWILYKLKLLTLGQYDIIVPRIINMFKVNYNITLKEEYKIKHD